jgi:hypothetical protein
MQDGHGERAPGFASVPDAGHDRFALAHHREHRPHRLDAQATVMPLAPPTRCEVGRISRGGLEGRIDDHAPITLLNEPLQGVIRDSGGGTRPPHNQPPLVQQQTQCAADNPAMIREAFTANLLGAAAFAHGVDQLDTIRVDDAEHRRGGQEDLRPALMGREEAKEPCPLRYVGEQGPIATRQPPIEGAVADALVGRRKARYLLKQGTSPHAPRLEPYVRLSPHTAQHLRSHLRV